MTTPERRAIEAHAAAWLETLSEWIRIPSVSAEPAHHDDVRRSAHYLARSLSDAGFPEVEVVDSGPYQPAVYAHWPSVDDDAVRVLVYGHHDVQPAAFADGWTYEPFEPHLVDGLLHGRGASDDKGNIGLHLLGLAAHLQATGRSTPAVDLTLLVEGEEESGSPHFEALLDDLGDRLDPDVVVISDTGIFDVDTPSVVTGMRGMVSGELHVRGPDVDLHSGSFGGGVANPITELVRILAAMRDADGHVVIPGFHDGVDEPTDAERSLLAALPFDEDEWVAGPAASRMPAGEAGYTTLERIGMRPTAEINGIWGGYTGDGSKTIIPTDAHAKLSFRLVGTQEPADIKRAVGDFVARMAGPEIAAEVTWHGGGTKPLVTPVDHPATRAVMRALAAAFDTDTVLVTREGGSGPEANLADRTGAAMAFLGVMTDADRIHAPDERAPTDVLLRGAEAVAHLWRELAEMGRSQFMTP